MGYNVTAIGIFLFFVALNVSIAWIASSGVLPVDFTSTNPDYVTDPTEIGNMFISVDVTTGNLALAGTALIVTTILGWIAGSMVTGGALGVGIFALTLLSPIVRWVLYGFPYFLNLMGVPVYITAGITAMLSVPLFFTVLSFLAQRPIEGNG